MNRSLLLASGIAALLLATAVPAFADVAPPQTGGTTSTTTTAVAGSGTTADSGDDGGCSVALVRNTSAAAAGLIAVALALGLSRLRRYGMR
jgi:hypothetical protein